MATDPRFCSNCRTELPPGLDSCPACGVYAGDVFDGKLPGRKFDAGFWLTLVVIAAAAAAGALWLEHASRDTTQPRTEIPVLPPTRVVKDRPGGSRRSAGAKLTEAESVRLLRRHLVAAKGIRNECLVLMGEHSGRANDTFVVYDRCDSLRLGRWRVDPASGEVKALHPTGQAISSP